MNLRLVATVFLGFLFETVLAAAPNSLPNTQPLAESGDRAAQMRAGVHQFLSALTERAVTNRARFWHRDFSSPAAYTQSVETNRVRLRQLIGAVDERVRPVQMTLAGALDQPLAVAESDLCSVHAVSWTVFGNVQGEGLLLRPKGEVRARVVVVPDADQTPEMLAGLETTPIPPVAQRLAEAGCEVIVPTLVNRDDTWSGNPRLKRFTNQPHREWIYRQAFVVGRHIIGYEVEKVLAAVDWLSQKPAPLPIGVLGYGEGGLIAFYASTLDSRIAATFVSGYFQTRQELWSEPIYRNVFGLLREFGDAELASLIAPRALFIEHSEFPTVTAPPPSKSGRTGAAPGRLQTPEQWAVESELIRSQEFFPRNGAVRSQAKLFNGSEGTPLNLGSKLALLEFGRALQLPPSAFNFNSGSAWKSHWKVDIAERQRRQVQQLEEHTQTLLIEAEDRRNDLFWKPLLSQPTLRTNLREAFAAQIVGRIDLPTTAAHPRSRFLQETAQWTAHEITLDVWTNVFAWGILLVPKGKSGPQPVVICQHGLEGVPADTINPDPASPAHRYYQAFAARLAERGYVVFSPHNLYRGGEDFRQLQRRAHPLGLSLYSIMLAQHEQILAWLSTQPFVNPKRIGFYGLSYGGKSALYLPALIDQYVLSINSGNFNDWARKLADTSNPLGYMFTAEYEMFEFNQANTFSHAEVAALIAPRPFMVERGHEDGVARDESVAYEYAKVRRYYDAIKLPDQTRLEVFSGGHTIHGVGTFEFLDRYLRSNP